MTSAVLDEPVWDNPFLSGLRSRAQDFLGTQGDGNHFAYVGRIQFSEGQRAAIESAGYPWTVIRVEQRQAYMATLENASVRRDISEFTRFVSAEMAASARFEGPKL